MLSTNFRKFFRELSKIIIALYYDFRFTIRQKIINLTYSRNRTNLVMKQELLRTSDISTHYWRNFSSGVKTSLYSKYKKYRFLQYEQAVKVMRVL